MKVVILVAISLFFLQAFGQGIPTPMKSMKPNSPLAGWLVTVNISKAKAGDVEPKNMPSGTSKVLFTKEKLHYSWILGSGINIRILWII